VGALDGKVALVTGGASGIGLASATRLHQEGADVVIADRDETGGRAAAEELGGRFVALDVADASAWRRVVDELGDLDLVHLNAGVTTGEGDITALTDEQYRRLLGANVDGVVFGCRAVVPALSARGGGAIVATASLAGIIAFAPDPLYTATKHAVVGLVRSLAPQLEAKGIRINAVCPGVVDTPLVGPARERLRESGFAMIPPSDIADAVFRCATGGFESGACVVCRAGRPPEPHRFAEAG
jgi:NAD(P)-dependent dehydrogenase (short-subunit alcohol dehydrogenase family)